MNTCTLMGRVVRDPEVRYSQGTNSMAIARFTLAVDRRGRANADGTREADFISCVAFGKLGEVAEKYYKKGTKLTLRGHIQTGSYQKQDGSKVYTTDVVVDDAEFAESKSAQGGTRGTGATGNGGAAPRSNGGNGNSVAYEDYADGFMNIPDGVEDEGLPFN